MKWEPHQYQKNAIGHIIANGCYGLFLDPGLGKTIIMLQAFRLLVQKKLVRRMLVIAPLRVCYSTWPAEAEKWETGLKVGVLHGPEKELVLRDPTVQVHVINPEGLPWLFGQSLGGKNLDPSLYWEVLCVDESTRFKAHNTLRFKIIRPQLAKFRRRYILTGSPAPNGLLDLWGQVFIMDMGHSLGPYISHYRTEYFDLDYTGFGWKPRKDSEARIYSKLRPLVLRMEAKDYLDLPPLIGACGFGSEPLVRSVELPEKARKIYDQMEQLFITEIKENKITAANAATASGKCRQIANGGLYGLEVLGGGVGSSGPDSVGPGRAVHQVHEAKLDAVEEIVEELQGTPALIAYEFRHDLEFLRKRFPRATYVDGASPKKFKEIENAWNRGEIETLLGQQDTIALGLNLQGTKAAVIMFSPTWNLETYDQLIRRVWRQGQAHPTYVHHIIAKNTIDEVILKMLQRKDKTQRALLSALKEKYA